MSARCEIRRTTALALLGGLASAALSGCFSDQPTTTSPVTTLQCSVPVASTVFGAEQTVIPIRDFGFRIDTVHVRRGSRVTWVNCDAEGHTSTSDTDVWSSPTIATGQTYSHVFDQAGRFRYHCIPHPFMTGTIVVD
jgi:plastocyanin